MCVSNGVVREWVGCGDNLAWGEVARKVAARWCGVVKSESGRVELLGVVFERVGVMWTGEE